MSAQLNWLDLAEQRRLSACQRLQRMVDDRRDAATTYAKHRAAGKRSWQTRRAQ